jgi:Spy/CpxP family protein refolding chaperone
MSGRSSLRPDVTDVPCTRPLPRVLIVLLAVALAVGGPVQAGAGQAGKFKWWQSERFVQELGLTHDQSARIDEVFQASWPALHAAKADLDRLETELSQLIAEGTASEARVLQQIDRVEASRSAMGRTRSLMLYRMHRLLTSDQRVKLKALYDAVEREKAQQQGPRPK